MKKISLLCTSLCIAVSVFCQNDILDETIDVQVCFNASHTFVSDIGFYLIAPGQTEIEPGNLGVLQLLPAASDWGPGAALGSWVGIPWTTLGCSDPSYENTTCNSGDSVVDLCFTSTLQAANPEFTACVCDMPTPLTGEFASVEAWDNVYGFPLIGSWGLRIYDCEGADVGALIGGIITFTNDMGMETVYTLNPISPIPINDNSCDAQSASLMVYSPDIYCTLDITIPNTSSASADNYISNCEFEDDDLPFEPFQSFDSITIVNIVQINSIDYDVTYQIHQGGNSKFGIFSATYTLGEELPEIMNLNLILTWENTLSGAVQTISVNHEVLNTSPLFTGLHHNNNNTDSGLVYPNPVSDILKFSELSESATITIYDQQGRIVLNNIKPENSRINVEAFRSGLYTVEVVEEGRKVKQATFVKK